MKVLMVEPGKVPYEMEIEDSLAARQAAVGGRIDATYPFEEMVGLISNAESKNIGLPWNRALYDDDGNLYDVVAGKFFIVGLEDAKFIDLSPELMEKFKEHFKHPEEFARLAGKIVAIKQPIPTEGTDAPKPSRGPELS